MPDLVALRARALDLIERKATMAACVRELRGIAVTFTSAIVNAAAEACDPDEEDEAFAALSSLPVGVPVPLFTEHALLAATGTPTFRDGGRTAKVEGAIGALEEFERHSTWVPDVSLGNEPSLEGLTAFEVSAIVEAYKSAIGRMTTELRDADTRAKYLADTRLSMPMHVRKRCLGMFGGPDFVTAFTYADGDFATYNTTEERVPRENPDDPRGPWRFIRTNHHPALMSARYMAPMIGDEQALRMENAFARLRMATAPRPGEPPSLAFFGSHDSNRIEVVYAPDETSVEVSETPTHSP